MPFARKSNFDRLAPESGMPEDSAESQKPEGSKAAAASEGLRQMLRGIYSKPKRLIAGIVASSFIASHVLTFPYWPTLPKANEYDFMIGETFRHDSGSIDRIVHAVPQEGNDGGPAYLINGLTEKMWWYQFGIEYKWIPVEDQNHFYFAYEIWDSKDSIANVDIVDPAKLSKKHNNPDTGVDYLSYTHSPSVNIRPWDWVELSIGVANGRIHIAGKDLNNGSAVELEFKANGCKFIGTRGNDSDIAGRFSGVLTEIYTYSNVPPREKNVEYVSPPYDQNKSPVIWYYFFGAGPKGEVYSEYDKEKGLNRLSPNIDHVNLGVGRLDISSNIFVTEYSK